MVQRTADRVADHESVGEGSVIVGAGRAYCVDTIADAREHHVILTHAAQHGAAARDARGWDPLREVWRGGTIGVCLCHERSRS